MNHIITNTMPAPRPGIRERLRSLLAGFPTPARKREKNTTQFSPSGSRRPSPAAGGALVSRRSRPADGSRARSWSWLASLSVRLSSVRQQRKLQLVENLALGEKRFLALVEVDGRRLLIGSTPTAITLIESLTPPRPSQQKTETPGTPTPKC